jgi:hypothetical protein
MPSKKPSPKSATPKPKSPTNPKPGDPKPKSTAMAVTKVKAAATKAKAKPIGRASATKSKPKPSPKMMPLDYSRFASGSTDGGGAYRLDQNPRATMMLRAEDYRRRDRREAANAAVKSTPMTARAKGLQQSAMNKKRGQRSGNG